MKAMIIYEFGGPDVLQMGEIEPPQVAPGQVIVEVAYAGVNPADWKAREGWLSAYFAYQFPFVVGFDAAGRVAEVGAGVSGLKVGDRVVTASNQGMGERGSYAEFVRSAAERVVRLPDHVPFDQATTLPTAGMTAWQAVLDNGMAGPGSFVLVNGGAGGTGSFAVQLARNAGARVAVTCSPANADYVRALGAELAIDYRQGGVFDAIRHWAPEGLDLIVDTVGQGSLLGAEAVMKRGGIIAPIATLIADEPTFDAQAVAAAGVQVVPTMSTFPEQPRQLRGLVDGLADTTLRAPEMHILPLSQAGDAHRLVQAGHVCGKILLEVNASL